MLRGLSVRQRIFWWSIGTTLAILVAVFFLVDRSLRATIVAGMEESVEAEARLAAELQRSSMNAGVERVASLAAVPTIRAAVETGDPATVRENLGAVLEEADAAWLAVASADGRMLASVGDAPAARIEDSDELLAQARYYDTGDLWSVDDELIQVNAGGVFFQQDLLGILLLGQRIDAEWLERLRVSEEQRIAILSGGSVLAAGAGTSEPDRQAIVAQWTDDLPTEVGEAEADSLGGLVREFELDGTRYLGMALPLPDALGRPAAHLLTYRSLREAMAPARSVRLALLGIAGAGLAFALLSSLVLSRRVTGPIDRLLGETIRIGSGDLDHPVEPESDDEIGHLAEGFEAMRASLVVAQRELVHAERLSAIGQAASGIVHDFNQPVTVIRANVDLLELDQGDPEAQAEDLAAIRTEVERLTTMMHEILDFARGDDRIDLASGPVEDLLDDVARRTEAPLRAQDTRIEVEHGWKGEWKLDFPRTARVLGNLVHNAANALESGGTIRIRSARRNGGLRLEVEDDGPGIPESLQENLFEPFVTSGKRNGTGLGLAIARSFTERQGGTITLDTSPDGTTFILDFPPTDVAGTAPPEGQR